MLYNIAMLGTTFYIGYRGMIQIDMKDYSIYTVSDTMLHQIETKIHTYPFIHSAILNIKENLAKEPGSITDEKSDNLKKYSGSSLTQPQKEILIQKLQNVMQYEKIFIDDKLSIEDVAVKLNSNTKYISQIINETFNKNFYNFINSYRMEAAKELLLSQENDKYSILGIAQTVGFVSKSAFNVSFKKFTGQTPTEFKRKGGIPI
jgi:AraC-like DNA-binding protein